MNAEDVYCTAYDGSVDGAIEVLLLRVAALEAEVQNLRDRRCSCEVRLA